MADRLLGAGTHSGVGAAPPGDLYVEVRVRPHRIFERDGDDLYCEVPIAFTMAAMGGELEIPTLDGHVKLKVPQETQTGRMFRLRGKGLPDVDGYARGALHVQVVPEVPSKLSSKQKKVLKEFAEMREDFNYPAIREFRQRAEAFFERKEAMKD